MNQNKYTASILTDHCPKNTVSTCDWLLPPVYILWLCLEYTIRPLVLGIITTKSCLLHLCFYPLVKLFLASPFFMYSPSTLSSTPSTKPYPAPELELTQHQLGPISALRFLICWSSKQFNHSLAVRRTLVRLLFGLTEDFLARLLASPLTVCSLSNILKKKV